MPILTREFDRAYARGTKRGTKRGMYLSYGRAPTPFIVRIAGDTAQRRVYEDWSRPNNRNYDHRKKSYQHAAQLVVLIKGVVYDLSPEHCAQLEALPLHDETR